MSGPQFRIINGDAAEVSEAERLLMQTMTCDVERDGEWWWCATHHWEGGNERAVCKLAADCAAALSPLLSATEERDDLRAALSSCQPYVDIAGKRITELVTEVERLRGEIKRLADGYRRLRDEWDQADADAMADQLRALLTEATS